MRGGGGGGGGRAVDHGAVAISLPDLGGDVGFIPDRSPPEELSNTHELTWRPGRPRIVGKIGRPIPCSTPICASAADRSRPRQSRTTVGLPRVPLNQVANRPR